MTNDRYKKLDSAGEGLTDDEIKQGWHFCLDWDQMLIGPGMQSELSGCACMPFRQKQMLYHGPEVLFKKLAPTAQLPKQSHLGECYDLFLPKAIDVEDWDRLNHTVTVGLGFATAIEIGWAAVVKGRSGISCKKLLIVPNTPGEIDWSYRGEWLLTMHSLTGEPYSFEAGERIAQMHFSKRWNARWNEVDELPISQRGDGGYGSTG